jgi:hypothetical protein
MALEDCEYPLAAFARRLRFARLLVSPTSINRRDQWQYQIIENPLGLGIEPWTRISSGFN